MLGYSKLKNKEIETTEEQKLLEKWRSEFMQDFHYFREWQTKKKEWERFYDGDQLSSEEKNALRKRNQPEVVINKIKPRIDGIIGDFLGQRVMMRARDRGTGDFEKAKYITEALRYVEDSARFDESETSVAQDLFISGVGWYKVSLEFDFLEPEIRVLYRPNDDIIVDRNCRLMNLKDAKRLYETIWVEVEDLIEIYPEFEKEIKEAASKDKNTWLADQGVLRDYIGDDYAQSENVYPNMEMDFELFFDPMRRRVRLINIWERVQKRVEYAFHPDLEGNVVDLSTFNSQELNDFHNNYVGADVFVRNRWELNSGIFIATKVLEYKKNIRPHDSDGKFPFSRAVAHFKRDESRHPYGMVSQYIDAQKEYNKRRSKLLHKSNTNRIVAEEGAMAREDIERTRQEAARPDGVVLYKTGRQFQIDNDRPDNADVFLLQLTQQEMDDSGISKEFIGTDNRVLSGKAINLRQITGNKMLRSFYAALRSARRDAFAIVLEEMQQYWTSEKLVKITDEKGSREVVLNQRGSIDGIPVIFNNLKLGKYDIKIDEDLETPNARSEKFQNLVQLGQLAVQAGEPFPLEMLIKESDLGNKEEWLQAILARRQQQMQLMQLQALAKADAARSNGQEDVTPT